MTPYFVSNKKLAERLKQLESDVEAANGPRCPRAPVVPRARLRGD